MIVKIFFVINNFKSASIWPLSWSDNVYICLHMSKRSYRVNTNHTEPVVEPLSFPLQKYKIAKKHTSYPEFGTLTPGVTVS